MVQTLLVLTRTTDHRNDDMDEVTEELSYFLQKVNVQNVYLIFRVKLNVTVGNILLLVKYKTD